ncbi:tyrosine-type recombinase/integrase [Corynebacterium ulceribovis]|uniref:tyrosine-type recombinase/integrase n=1 Tax=Corynebacterium ulceribovis TaxID=487732 RepID=UPI000368E69A|nr:tyrosine-type recombinase/integrase [Corynebacterium ulceribovis]
MAEFGNIRELPSGRYQARYFYRGTFYKAPSTFRTERLAASWLTKEEELITFDKWTPPQDRQAKKAKDEARKRLGTVTVGQWLETFHDGLRTRMRPIKESTLQSYMRAVNGRIMAPIPPGDSVHDITRLKNIALSDLTKDDVHRWWDALGRTYDTPTINQNAYKRLRAALAHAVERDLIDANPVSVRDAAARVKRKEKYLPEDWELKAILKEMPARYKVLTSLVLFHGLRIGEGIAVEHPHLQVIGEVPYAPRIIVTVEQNAQRLVETGPDGKRHTYLNWQSTKTDAGVREVPIMASHTQLFFEHLEQFPPVTCTVRCDDGTKTVSPLTVTENGKPVMDTSYRSRLTAAEKRAGVSTEIHPHCGRNWLITRLAEQGAHLKEIGKLLGQTDLETITNIYMKVRAGRTDILMDKVDASLQQDEA